MATTQERSQLDSQARPRGQVGSAGPSGPKGDTGAQGERGRTGPKGDTGPSGADGASGSSSFLLLATENIGAFVAVTSNGKVANSATTAHAGKVAGVSLAAITSGFTGSVQSVGEVENPSWTWTAGDVIYINGTSLSTTAPSTGFSQRIGTAKSATKIVVELGEPILL